MSGRGHFERGIKSEYLEVLGPVFAHSVRPLLVNKDLWSLKLEEVFFFSLCVLFNLFLKLEEFFFFSLCVHFYFSQTKGVSFSFLIRLFSAVDTIIFP